MKVFVTGATGYIGSAICDSLLAHGHSVTGLARSDAAHDALIRQGVTPHRGTLQDRSTLVIAIERADAVIHTASTNDADAAAADLHAVSAILDTQRGQSKRFIYTSGIWMYGNTSDSVIDSTTALSPTQIVRWRLGIESYVRAASLDGVHTSIIRPAIVYGRGGGLPRMFADTARTLGAARYVGTGTNRWPVVHVDALADLYLRVLERGKAGFAWIGAHGPAYAVRELAAAASEGAGAEGRTIAWPVKQAHETLGWLAEALALDQQADTTQERLLLKWTPAAPDILNDLRAGSYRQSTSPQRATLPG